MVNVVKIYAFLLLCFGHWCPDALAANWDSYSRKASIDFAERRYSSAKEAYKKALQEMTKAAVPLHKVVDVKLCLVAVLLELSEVGEAQAILNQIDVTRIDGVLKEATIIRYLTLCKQTSIAARNYRQAIADTKRLLTALRSSISASSPWVRQEERALMLCFIHVGDFRSAAALACEFNALSQQSTGKSKSTFERWVNDFQAHACTKIVDSLRQGQLERAYTLLPVYCSLPHESQTAINYWSMLAARTTTDKKRYCLKQLLNELDACSHLSKSEHITLAGVLYSLGWVHLTDDERFAKNSKSLNFLKRASDILSALKLDSAEDLQLSVEINSMLSILLAENSSFDEAERVVGAIKVNPKASNLEHAFLPLIQARMHLARKYSQIGEPAKCIKEVELLEEQATSLPEFANKKKLLAGCRIHLKSLLNSES